MSRSLHFLQVEPTTRCNYTCGFCAGRHMDQVDMEFSQFTQLIDALPDLKHIELQGEGEPLLHGQFFAMVNYARKKFPKVKISLITNGSMFTPENIPQLLTAGISRIMVSLETADETEFQAIRGGKLSRVKRGLEALMAAKISCGNATPKIGFAVTLLRNNYRQIGAIAALYEALGLDGGIMLQPLQTMEAYVKYYDQPMRENLLHAEDFGQLNRIIASDHVLNRTLLQHAQSSNFYIELFQSATDFGGGCPWLKNGLAINAEGFAVSCCFVKNSADGFAALNNNLPAILDLRQQLDAKLSAGEIPNQCRDCTLLTSGMVGRN